jgi:hypothetical protein
MTGLLAAVPVPVPVMVRRYRCPFCSRSRSSKAATADHIARCWLNPEVRSCRTCAHLDRDLGGEWCFPGRPCNCNDGGQECRLDVDLPESGLPVTGCPLWELAAGQ